MSSDHFSNLDYIKYNAVKKFDKRNTSAFKSKPTSSELLLMYDCVFCFVLDFILDLFIFCLAFGIF